MNNSSSQTQTNKMAIVSLVAGLIAWGVGFTIWGNIPPVPQIIFFSGILGATISGHIALWQIKRSGKRGRGIAIIGLIMGWTGIAFLGFLVWLLFFAPPWCCPMG